MGGTIDWWLESGKGYQVQKWLAPWYGQGGKLVFRLPFAKVVGTLGHEPKSGKNYQPNKRQAYVTHVTIYQSGWHLGTEVEE